MERWFYCHSDLFLEFLIWAWSWYIIMAKGFCASKIKIENQKLWIKMLRSLPTLFTLPSVLPSYDKSWRWFLETVCRQGPRCSFWDGNAVFAEILKHIWFWSPPGLFCNYRCMTTAKLLLQTPRAGFKRLQRLPGSSLHFNDWAKFIITR